MAKRNLYLYEVVDIIGQGHVFGVDLEQGDSSLLIGPIDGDMAIKTTWPQQGGVEHVRSVGGSQYDHRLGRAEAVHFTEDLIEGLLTLVMPPAEPCSADAADGIDFVDEQNRGGGLFGGLEQVPHA